MLKNITKSLWLLAFGLILVCVVNPGVLWLIGKTFFSFEANGSLVNGPDGKAVGSLLIAQPFTKPEYFQPRPSSAGTNGYDASASAPSALAASNYALRDRVARAIAPVAAYKGGANDGKPVAHDVEVWFQKDQYQGNPGIVAQWADAHSGLVTAWVNADPTHAQYISDWMTANPVAVNKFKSDNPATTQPAATDMATVFFEQFSKAHPGKFPSATGATTGPAIAPTGTGSDVQTIFFEMWREDHPDIALADVPGDYVTASGSGLDPHITLANAEFQLDGVTAAWAKDTKRDVGAVKKEIEQILHDNAAAPLGGLAGEPLVNVLQVNLLLRSKYGSPA